MQVNLNESIASSIIFHEEFLKRIQLFINYKVLSMQQRIPTHCLDMMPYKFLKQARYDDCLITIICNLDQVCTFDSMLLFNALTKSKFVGMALVTYKLN